VDSSNRAAPVPADLKRRRREQAPLQLRVVHPFRHRPVMPTTFARRRYSATADRFTPTDTAICRSLRPSACSISGLRGSSYRRYQDLATHYGTVILPTRLRRAKRVP
jgi:hypothetical protein